MHWVSTLRDKFNGQRANGSLVVPDFTWNLRNIPRSAPGPLRPLLGNNPQRVMVRIWVQSPGGVLLFPQGITVGQVAMDQVVGTDFREFTFADFGAMVCAEWQFIWDPIDSEASVLEVSFRPKKCKV